MHIKFLAILLVSGFLLIGCSTGHHKYNEQTAGKFPIYGNWCGPEHPVDTSKAPDPVDRLDASCKVHDLCYEEKGYFNCGCDAQLTKDIRDGLKNRIYASNERRMARTVHNYFKASPCEGDTQDKVAPTRVLQKAYKTGEKAVKDIWDKFSDEEDAADKPNKQDESAVEAEPAEKSSNEPEMI